MLTSFVVRVTSAAQAAGVFAGEVEHVQSGERGDFRNADELHAWFVRLLPPAARDPRSTPADGSVAHPSSGAGDA